MNYDSTACHHEVKKWDIATTNTLPSLLPATNMASSKFNLFFFFLTVCLVLESLGLCSMFQFLLNKMLARFTCDVLVAL